MTKILYISSLCSEKLLEYIFKTAKQKPEQAAQKFHRLLTEGFAVHEKNCSIETLSTLPVTPSSHEKKRWLLPTEIINGVTYKYVPLLNVRFLKNIGVFTYTFFKVFFWAIFSSTKSKVVICDILNITITAAAQYACRLTKTKTIAIVTDIPGMMVINDSAEKRFKVTDLAYKNLVKSMLHRFDQYILLTEQMNTVVNPFQKPFMIMEGLVDRNMNRSLNELKNKEEHKILIYAGGLYEKYGVKTLIEAFVKLKDENIRLHLYGKGEMVKDMATYSRGDSRILFKGMVPNKVVVENQLRATLLINPRPTSEEFTKFSFPSKNMEYMVSGTPMVTTHLPGMPKEYLNYVFIFEDESVNGMSKALEAILFKSKEELHDFAATAKAFVIQNKSNHVQAKRILHFINS